MASEGGPHGEPMVHVRVMEFTLSMEPEPALGDAGGWREFNRTSVFLQYRYQDRYAVMRRRWYLARHGETFRWERMPMRDDPAYDGFMARTEFVQPEALNLGHQVLRGEHDDAPEVVPPAR